MSFLTARYNASGPILDVFVSVSEPRARAMAAKGLATPPGLKLSFIVDTGADSTMVDEQHMRSLGIPECGAKDILTVTSDATPTRCSTYDVQLRLEARGEPAFIVPSIEAFGRPLFNHSIDGMIGRDVLDRLLFSMNGPSRTFRIDY